MINALKTCFDDEDSGYKVVELLETNGYFTGIDPEKLKMIYDCRSAVKSATKSAEYDVEPKNGINKPNSDNSIEQNSKSAEYAVKSATKSAEYDIEPKNGINKPNSDNSLAQNPKSARGSGKSAIKSDVAKSEGINKNTNITIHNFNNSSTEPTVDQLLAYATDIGYLEFDRNKAEDFFRKGHRLLPHMYIHFQPVRKS